MRILVRLFKNHEVIFYLGKKFYFFKVYEFGIIIQLYMKTLLS